MTNIIPGQQLGPYRIIAQIGQGGMAAVYKAYHAAMDRHVAVKVLPGEFAKSPAFTARFQQEARTVANLEHPHILPVHDFGESEGLTYLVMRYLEAGTLASRIEHNPPTLPEIDRIFSQLAGAPAYAHHRGVVHRDLKPSNVLIDSRGDVFLTDKVFIYDDLVYAAGWGGVSVWDRTDGALVRRFTTADGLPDADLSSIFVDGEDSIWVSGDVGLARRNPDGAWETFGQDNPFEYDEVQVYDIAEDAHNGIWIATNGNGLYRYRNGKWDHFDFDSTGGGPASDLVFSVTGSPDGSVWAGANNGATRFDGVTWQTIFDSPDRLISPIVNDIYVAPDGAVYFATEGGMTRFQP